MNKKATLLFLLHVLILVGITYLNARAQPQLTDTINISDDLELIRISDNSYIHISYLVTSNGRRVPCNGLIYINGDEAFIIDTPVNDEITLDLINWLKLNPGKRKLSANILVQPIQLII